MKSRKLYVSLHTADPCCQGHHEVNYPGYQRVRLFLRGIGHDTIAFPAFNGGVDALCVTHAGIGRDESGCGKVVPVELWPLVMLSVNATIPSVSFSAASLREIKALVSRF